MTDKQTTPENEETPETPVTYLVYKGKRLFGDKLHHTYAYCNEAGTEILRDGYHIKKFNFVQGTPSIGWVYRVEWADNSLEQFYVRKAHQASVHLWANAERRRKWSMEHKAATVEYDTIRAKKKDLSRDEVEDMTVSEIRDLMRESTAAKRRAITAALLEYINR